MFGWKRHFDKIETASLKLLRRIDMGNIKNTLSKMAAFCCSSVKKIKIKIYIIIKPLPKIIKKILIKK